EVVELGVGLAQHVDALGFEGIEMVHGGLWRSCAAALPNGKHGRRKAAKGHGGYERTVKRGVRDTALRARATLSPFAAAWISRGEGPRPKPARRGPPRGRCRPGSGAGSWCRDRKSVV